ncbi:XyeA family putative rSAM-modified RiPP [Tistrella mobilis]|jgi:putative rSAM-modified RiPP (XyeA family)|uniref:XyeA family cyclophane-containing RiPP triceptide n=1 Tax=Tistrella mobilis TaxID=171437 RepID=UPI003555F5D6
MSKLRQEIRANAAEVAKAETCSGQLQRLSDDLLDQIAGGWVNAFAKWSKSF